MHTTRRTLLKAGTCWAAPPGRPGLRPTPQPGAKLPKLLLGWLQRLAVSNALIHIVDAGLLNDVAEQVERSSGKTPDQLRAMAVEGKADFIAMPSNVRQSVQSGRGAATAGTSASGLRCSWSRAIRPSRPWPT